jgi:asparagine synthase (glutamine-hydrolysing)
VEVRSPFLDTAFVEFAASLPGHFKIRDGQTKYLLKKAAERYFPHEMIYRKKEGFLMPLNEWILHGLEEYVRATLAPSRLRLHGLFDEGRVQQLVDSLYCDKRAVDRAVNQVYALLVFQEWHNLYMS